MSGAITTLEDAKRELNRLATRVNSTSRLTRGELMAMLAKIYTIRLTGGDQARLLEYVIEQRKLEGANRAYLLRSNNPFVLPLRYVFPSVKDRCNVSRYAGALRELNRLEVPGDRFLESVKEHGGLTELYWQGRARETKKQARSKLTLDRTIVVVSGQPLTLHLLPQANGIFKVLDFAKAAA